MKNIPIFAFEDTQATGITKVPLNAMVYIIDPGNGDIPKLLRLISMGDLNSSSTIQDLLDNPELYIEINASKGNLEKIIEGGKTGYKILGRELINFGETGHQSINLTYNNEPSEVVGATGNYAFASGKSSTASGNGSTALGGKNISSGVGSIVSGYNTQTEGGASLAEGGLTLASGNMAHAEGFGTGAIGNISHAEGVGSFGHISIGTEQNLDTTSLLNHGGPDQDNIMMPMTMFGIPYHQPENEQVIFELFESWKKLDGSSMMTPRVFISDLELNNVNELPNPVPEADNNHMWGFGLAVSSTRIVVGQLDGNQNTAKSIIYDYNGNIIFEVADTLLIMGNILTENYFVIPHIDNSVSPAQVDYIQVYNPQNGSLIKTIAKPSDSSSSWGAVGTQLVNDRWLFTLDPSYNNNKGQIRAYDLKYNSNYIIDNPDINTEMWGFPVSFKYMLNQFPTTQTSLLVFNYERENEIFRLYKIQSGYCDDIQCLKRDAEINFVNNRTFIYGSLAGAVYNEKAKRLAAITAPLQTDRAHLPLDGETLLHELKMDREECIASLAKSYAEQLDDSKMLSENAFNRTQRYLSASGLSPEELSLQVFDEENCFLFELPYPEDMLNRQDINNSLWGFDFTVHDNKFISVVLIYVVAGTDGHSYIKEKVYHYNEEGTLVGTNEPLASNFNNGNSDTFFSLFFSSSINNHYFALDFLPTDTTLQNGNVYLRNIDENYGDFIHGENAIGYASHTEGFKTKASGSHGAHAEGRLTLASGVGSHAEGYKSQATNRYAHTEGVCTTASGFASHTEGLYNKNDQHLAHVEGLFNTLGNRGYGSHVEGIYNTSNGYFTHTAGGYNTNIGVAGNNISGGFNTISDGIVNNITGLANLINLVTVPIVNWDDDNDGNFFMEVDDNDGWLEDLAIGDPIAIVDGFNTIIERLQRFKEDLPFYILDNMWDKRATVTNITGNRVYLSRYDFEQSADLFTSGFIPGELLLVKLKEVNEVFPNLNNVSGAQNFTVGILNNIKGIGNTVLHGIRNNVAGYSNILGLHNTWQGTNANNADGVLNFVLGSGTKIDGALNKRFSLFGEETDLLSSIFSSKIDGIYNTQIGDLLGSKINGIANSSTHFLSKSVREIDYDAGRLIFFDFENIGIFEENDQIIINNAFLPLIQTSIFTIDQIDDATHSIIIKEKEKLSNIFHGDLILNAMPLKFLELNHFNEDILGSINTKIDGIANTSKFSMFDDISGIFHRNVFSFFNNTTGLINTNMVGLLNNTTGILNTNVFSMLSTTEGAFNSNVLRDLGKEMLWFEHGDIDGTTFLAFKDPEVFDAARVGNSLFIVPMQDADFDNIEDILDIIFDLNDIEHLMSSGMAFEAKILDKIDDEEDQFIVIEFPYIGELFDVSKIIVEIDDSLEDLLPVAMHTEGLFNNAYGLAAHTEGVFNKSTILSHTEGVYNTSGFLSHTEGFLNTDAGLINHMDGIQNTATFKFAPIKAIDVDENNFTNPDTAILIYVGEENDNDTEELFAVGDMVTIYNGDSGLGEIDHPLDYLDDMFDTDVFYITEVGEDFIGLDEVPDDIGLVDRDINGNTFIINKTSHNNTEDFDYKMLTSSNHVSGANNKILGSFFSNVSGIDNTLHGGNVNFITGYANDISGNRRNAVEGPFNQHNTITGGYNFISGSYQNVTGYKCNVYSAQFTDLNQDDAMVSSSVSGFQHLVIGPMLDTQVGGAFNNILPNSTYNNILKYVVSIDSDQGTITIDSSQNLNNMTVGDDILMYVDTMPAAIYSGRATIATINNNTITVTNPNDLEPISDFLPMGIKLLKLEDVSDLADNTAVNSLINGVMIQTESTALDTIFGGMHQVSQTAGNILSGMAHGVVGTGLTSISGGNNISGVISGNITGYSNIIYPKHLSSEILNFADAGQNTTNLTIESNLYNDLEVGDRLAVVMETNGNSYPAKTFFTINCVIFEKLPSNVIRIDTPVEILQQADVVNLCWKVLDPGELGNMTYQDYIIGSGAHGFGNKVTANFARAEGQFTIAQNDNMLATGILNVGTAPDTIVEVGIGGTGEGGGGRKNAFEVYTNGQIRAPEATSDLVDINDQNLVPVSYLFSAEFGNRLPTTDPHVQGKIWNDAGSMKISAG